MLEFGVLSDAWSLPAKAATYNPFTCRVALILSVALRIKTSIDRKQYSPIFWALLFFRCDVTSSHGYHRRSSGEALCNPNASPFPIPGKDDAVISTGAPPSARILLVQTVFLFLAAIAAGFACGNATYRPVRCGSCCSACDDRTNLLC